MSRLSTDELAPDGTILNGYDYNIQCWVVNGHVQMCAHPSSMRRRPDDGGVYPCCPAWEYAGRDIRRVPGHEVRKED